MDKNKQLELLSSFTTALSNCSLYSSAHPIVRSLAEKAAGAIEDLMGGNETLGLMIIDNQVVFDQDPLNESSLHITTFARRMRRKGVNKLIFKKGTTVEEIVTLINDIADPSGTVSRYPHISTGFVEVRLDGLALEGLGREEIDRIRNNQIDKLKDIYGSVGRFKKLDVAGLEDIVINFVSVFQRESNILNFMSPVKSYSEFTYTHAVNVSVVSVFLAQALGVKGDYLHDIGIAALLHDIGKLFISNEILEKKGKLDKDEWEEMQKHTIYGAKYLLGVDNVPKLSVMAALEHHMRYDGTGYPELNRLRKKQHIFSQIIAISDVFDALRAKRPYRDDMEAVEVLSIIRKDAGTAFNPVFVDIFSRNLGQHISLEE